MRGLVSAVGVLCICLPVLSSAGPLGKYTEGADLQRGQAPTVTEIEQRLERKISQAVEYINSLPPNQRRELKSRYRDKLADAERRKNRLEAAYYRGIVEGIRWEDQP